MHAITLSWFRKMYSDAISINVNFLAIKENLILEDSKLLWLGVDLKGLVLTKRRN